MKIFIYEPNNKEKNYLPFNLYIKCLYSILKNYQYDIKIIDNLELINTNNFLFVLFFYCLNENIINYIKNKNIKILLINTENYKNFNIEEKLQMLILNNLNFYIFEYNPINIKYLKNKYENINIYYIPLLYNVLLIDYYNSNIIKKIKYNEKDIDIIFYGTLNERRSYILNNLKLKYNIMIISKIFELSHSELFNYIERSKVVLNIYYYEDNYVFDYYRNAILLSNKIFLISEYPDYIDFDIEKNLKNIENNLILSKYENIIDTVSNYLDNFNEIQINNIVNNQYNWFKEYDMNIYILNLFNNMSN
jgi:hypothetical protein